MITPQDLDVINKAILASVFCLGLVFGGLISLVVTSLTEKKNGL